MSDRGLSRCSRYQGWHVYKAGPCFNVKAEAVVYRDKLDALGKKWWPQGEYLPDRREGTSK